MGARRHVWAAAGLAALLQAFVFARPCGAQSAPQAEKPSAAYLLRATSRWATTINEVLSRVAREVEVVVPAGQAVEKFLSTYCVGAAPDFEMAGQSDRGLQKIRMSPCVRVRRNVEVEVTDGDTLEGLAIRHGLPGTAAGRLKVKSENQSTASRIPPKTLKAGDTVVVPEVPIWTSVVPKADVQPDRASILNLLATALKCGNEDPEQCLAKREVTLLERGVPKREPDAEPPRAPSASSTSGVILGGRGGGGGETRTIRTERASRRTSGETAATARETMPAPVPPLPPPPPPPAAGSPRSAGAPVAATPVAAVAEDPPAAGTLTTIGVARGQWPYDAELLGKILSADADKIDRQATVGIADGGLGSAAGAPLPASVFAPSPEEINRIKKNIPEPDTEDNDGNFYLNDFFGAGLKRFSEDLGDLLGSGDMGLCRSAQPDFSKWPFEYSHGTVVASIAAALGVRTQVPAAADLLPKLVFFRLLGDTCAPDAGATVKEAEMFAAYEYLERRSRFIGISYKFDDSTAGDVLRSRLAPRVPNLDGLLILAAGNQNINLDANGAICPACLGHSSDERGGAAAKRTIVVGAATSGLLREPHSNYGKDTVKLFAPGDPTPGIDLLRNPAPASEASTSFAAPYVALAASIIASFRAQKNSWADIRDRLEASVWPLYDPDTGTELTGIGVVDLVKAAAMRHDAIEVKETEGNQLVRRTYVGTLLTTIDGQVCPGFSLTDAKVHALRLSEPDANGFRVVRAHHRSKRDPAATWKRKVDVLPACRPTGSLQLRTLSGEVKTFSLDDITHILLAWIQEV